MKKIIAAAILALSALASLSQNKVSEHTLSNGMTVWLHEDHTSRKVFGAVVVKAGGIDCPSTGIAHYFEHIAFKGTDKIGTIDYAKEKPLLDSIETYYGELKTQTTDSARLEIQQKINRLSIESAKYVIPGEFERLLATYGGTGVNAYTSPDRTVYFNSFSPQYVAQWCELNSERLLNPVFRLFQSELETVYEEKNMYDNNFLSKSMERIQTIYYNDSPYAQPLIGTTENLKNPDMVAMRAYYDKFYTARNMMLVVAGDFAADSILPILEQTFGRIKPGESLDRSYTPTRAIAGREDLTLKVPIPIVRARLYGWKGITESNPDRLALRLATDLLSNSDKTGYLDSLSANGKWLFAGLVTMPAMREGMLGAIVVPNLLGGSMQNAEKMLFTQIDRVKRGDVDPQFFESVKLSLKKEYDQAIENFDNRTNLLIELMSNEGSWTKFCQEVDLIDRITMSQVEAAAKKYLNDNYYCITKKSGSYPKEQPLKKPPFDPIKPHNKGAKSTYAAELEKMPAGSATPMYVDVAKDAVQIEITEKAKLFATENQINDLFSLSIIFGKGKLSDPRLSYMTEYLDYVGTDSLNYTQFKAALQRLGAEISISGGNNTTVATLRGYEKNFDQSLRLFVDFLKSPAKDKKVIKKIVSSAVMSHALLSRESSAVAEALLQHVRLGDQSPYKTDLTTAQVSKIKVDDYLALFADVQQSQCEIAYFGKLQPADVATKLSNAYDFSHVTNPSVWNNRPQAISYHEPTVFFVDFPKATQSTIYSYTPFECESNLENQLRCDLASACIGGGMGSQLFEQIREYRSLAYNVNGNLWLQSPVYKSRFGSFIATLSTQNDKAHQAIAVLDSLYENMKFDSADIVNARRSMINDIFQEYPAARYIAPEVIDLVRNGYSVSPQKYMFENVAKVSGEELLEFYRTAIGDRKIVYLVVGNSKKIDMKELEKFGRIVRLRPSDLRKTQTTSNNRKPKQ